MVTMMGMKGMRYDLLLLGWDKCVYGLCVYGPGASVDRWVEERTKGFG